MANEIREPDFSNSSPIGKAWKLTKKSEAAEQAAALSTWLVYAPWASKVIEYYLVGTNHLRPIKGTAKPFKSFPQAEYEFRIIGVDPYRHPHPIDPDSGPFHVIDQSEILLQAAPYNLFDEDLINIAETAAQMIVVGDGHPAEPHKHAWAAAFAKAVEAAQVRNLDAGKSRRPLVGDPKMN